MSKRKADPSVEQKVAAARKGMLTASPKSQEYKEAKKFLEEYEAKKKDVVEQPAHDETEEDLSDEDEGTDEDGDDGDGAGMTTTEEAQPSSSKRAKVAGEGDKEKVVTKKKGKKVKTSKPKPMKTVVKNYAPEEKADHNIILFDGNIGSGYSVKLSKRVKNELCYIQIRRNSTAGTTIPATLTSKLISALDDIKNQFLDMLLPEEKNNENVITFSCMF